MSFIALFFCLIITAEEDFLLRHSTLLHQHLAKLNFLYSAKVLFKKICFLCFNLVKSDLVNLQDFHLSTLLHFYLKFQIAVFYLLKIKILLSLYLNEPTVSLQNFSILNKELRINFVSDISQFKLTHLSVDILKNLAIAVCFDSIFRDPDSFPKMLRYL